LGEGKEVEEERWWTLMRDWWMEADGLRQWRSTAGAGAKRATGQSPAGPCSVSALQPLGAAFGEGPHHSPLRPRTAAVTLHSTAFKSSIRSAQEWNHRA
jgi:hypothetical protein